MTTMATQFLSLFGFSGGHTREDTIDLSHGIDSSTSTSTFYSLSGDSEGGHHASASPSVAQEPVSLHTHLKLDLRNLHHHPPIPSDEHRGEEDSSNTNQTCVNDAVQGDEAAPPILVLGTQGSGKSTFIKQIVLRFGTETSLNLLQESCRLSLYCHIIECTRRILESDSASEDNKYTTAILRMRLAPLLALETSLRSHLYQSTQQRIGSNIDDSGHLQSSATIAPHVFSALANDIGLLLGNSDLIADTYLIASLPRICSQDYVPSWNDILHFQINSTGIEEHMVMLPEAGHFRLCDVSKSGGKRPIWTRFFENAACIIYIIDTSVFDEPCGQASNQLEESFRQLTKLRKEPLLRKVNVFVLLNKPDLLKLKIKTGASFGAAMKDYGGPTGSYRAALRYMQDRVEKIAQEDRPRTALGAHLKPRQIKSSVINCTRADSVEKVVQLLSRDLSSTEAVRPSGRMQVLQSFLHV